MILSWFVRPEKQVREPVPLVPDSENMPVPVVPLKGRLVPAVAEPVTGPARWEVIGEAPSRGKGRRVFVRCPSCRRVLDRARSNVLRSAGCLECHNAGQHGG